MESQVVHAELTVMVAGYVNGEQGLLDRLLSIVMTHLANIRSCVRIGDDDKAPA